MSKKSRKRNKRLLALAGLIGVGMAAKNKRNASIDKGIKSAEDDKGSEMLSKKTDYITKKKKDTPTVKTKRTIQDNKRRNKQPSRTLYYHPDRNPERDRR